MNCTLLGGVVWIAMLSGLVFASCAVHNADPPPEDCPAGVRITIDHRKYEFENGKIECIIEDADDSSWRAYSFQGKVDMGKFDVKVYWSEWLPSEGSFLFEDESKGTTIEDDMVVTSSIFEETNGKASGIYNAVLASDDDFWINVCFTDVECAHTPGQGS